MVDKMEYINSSFPTLGVLDDIDQRLSDLNIVAEKIKSIAASRFNSTNYSNDDEEGALKKPIAKVILQKLNELGDYPDNNIDVLKVERLEDEYGSLKLLADLRTRYSTRSDLRSAIQFLEASEAIERGISTVKETSDLLLMSNEIKALSNFEADIKDDVIKELEVGLREKIGIFREDEETFLRSAMHETGFDELKPSQASRSPGSFTVLDKPFSNMITLQQIYGRPEYPQSWWAIDVLLEPICVRFNYHFNTASKETNRLSKPEWALNFIESFLNDNLEYYDSVFGSAFEKTQSIFAYEVITSILKPVRYKVMKMIDVINDNIEKSQENPSNYENSGRLLSHLIFELTGFDQRLRVAYLYNPFVKARFSDSDSKRKWGGLVGDIFISEVDSQSVTAENWLQLELSLAEKSFSSEVLGFSNSLKIDKDFRLSPESNYSATENRILKPTFSAFNLKKFVENLTGHFSSINIVKYQLKFVSNIQLKLIERYLEHLKANYKQLNDKFFSALGFVHGKPEKSSVGAVSATVLLENITALYCSAKFIHNSLEKWSNDLIFIQLWNAYISYSLIEHEENSSIFETCINNYGEFVSNCMEKLEEFFKREIRKTLKAYVNSNKWNEEFTGSDLVVSSDILLLNKDIPLHLENLRKAFADTDYCILTDRIVGILSGVIQEYVISSNVFSRKGVQQLGIDVESILTALEVPLLLSEKLCITNRSNKAYLKLIQSISLLKSLNPQIAKEYRSNTVDLSQLRSKFDDHLSDLNDYEINDLSMRML